MSIKTLVRALRRFVPSGDVTERAVKSGIWVALINVVDRALLLGMQVALLLLLSPTEIGLMGIAMLVLAGLKQFSHLGVDAALVQREESNVDAYLNTAWCLNIARGVALATVAYLLAPWAAAFFDAPQATAIIRFVALTPLLSGLVNPGVLYFQKGLEFHRQFGYTLSSTVVRVVVTLGYALVSPSVWALAVGFVAGQTALVFSSYLLHDYRPWPAFRVDAAREMLGYGKWIFGSSVVGFLHGQGDDAFVGWFLGASALGLYQPAYRFSNAPATEISQTLSQVTFPTFSKLQNDVAQLRTGFLRTIQLVAFASFPMAVGIALVTPSFVAFLGDEWLPMILPMQLLAVYGLLRSIRSPTTPLFRAVGRPDYQTKIKTLKLALIVAFIYPATAEWGLAGTALVIAANEFVTTPIAAYLSLRVVDGRPAEFLRVLGYPAIGSAIMGAGVFLVRASVPLDSPLATFALLVATGVLLYALVMLGIEHRFDYGMGDIVRTAHEAVR
ncbi:lipopolysaccharide biosynthesis protein [Halomarina pelagica]|uniref:lipopolysaccharide biosynthesis protein n=1 Tax=Halomarina pelagica TaxID=2961599 RepID=UPI0020C42239|nr:lipopolysaccharide biosynthesis protein [Halomarina sp. BND7]